jgi:IS30 family transposase
MARHLTITRSLGAPVYFCDLSLALAARLEREHERAAARLLSQGTDLSIHSPRHLLAVENELNN